MRRLFAGWEGNINIKWLGRVQHVDQPYLTRDEAASYTDFMPDGKARWFTFVMEAKCYWKVLCNVECAALV